MTVDELEQIAISALYRAYEVHEDLGSRGEVKLQKNQFGETALCIDIKAEEAVIDTLKTAHVPIRLISEEHGVIDIAEKPVFLGVLDGLDGSNVYLSQRGRGRYGTMLGIFSNLAPVYEDYLCCGVMIPSPKQELFFASRGHGSSVTIDGKRKMISCSDTTELQNTTKIYVDNNFEINRTLAARGLTECNLACENSSAVHYTDVAKGAADAALECTRKQNLEIAVAYGLIRESGGVMITLDEISLGNRHYQTFSQDKYTPIVTASTLKLAHNIVQHITSR